MSLDLDRIMAAVAARAPDHVCAQRGALRLFHGFTEGDPTLVLEQYAHALVIQDHAPPAPHRADELTALARALQQRWPCLTHALWKSRRAEASDARLGVLVAGDAATLPRQIDEDGVRYALDLRLGRDTSFYLDTRLLRGWLRVHARNAAVLNTFAHTGSLGVAARMAPAARVVQTDRNPRVLELARRSLALNQLACGRDELVAADFFRFAAGQRRRGQLFDVVVLDPPFFSTSGAGSVDMAQDLARTVMKLKPLVAHEGRLVVVNNALFLSGEAFSSALAELCADGYMAVEERLDVPADARGLVEWGEPVWPVSPAPFSFPTKIVVLRVRRGDQRPSSLPA